MFLFLPFTLLTNLAKTLPNGNIHNPTLNEATTDSVSTNRLTGVGRTVDGNLSPYFTCTTRYLLVDQNSCGSLMRSMYCLLASRSNV